jgi:hypothetical protein
MASKLLLLDIETAPTLAYVWRMYDENIGVEQIVKPTRITCWAAKWVGKKGVMFASEWQYDRKVMLQTVWDLLQECDAVLTYNGDKFDLPKLMGEFAREGLGSPGQLTSIDLYKTVRKLGFQSNKLEFAAPHLGIGEKVKNSGFRLWAGIEAGDPQARKEMEKYNRQDTVLLEGLYKTIRPFIKNHPYLGIGGVGECPACGSSNIQRRGMRRTKAFFIERLHCQACGSWSDGVRRKAAAA